MEPVITLNCLFVDKKKNLSYKEIFGKITKF